MILGINISLSPGQWYEIEGISNVKWHHLHRAFLFNTSFHISVDSKCLRYFSSVKLLCPLQKSLLLSSGRNASFWGFRVARSTVIILNHTTDKSFIKTSFLKLLSGLFSSYPCLVINSVALMLM